MVETIEWMDGNGELRYASKGSDLFNAVAISFGLFGVITLVVFKVRERYMVEGVEFTNVRDKTALKDS